MSAMLHLRRQPFEVNKPTLGYFALDNGNGFIRRLCDTLELPWRDNMPRRSCIPAGVYDMIWVESPRLRKLTWRLVGVPGRDGILVHAANFDHQLLGCIAPGLGKADINKDGRMDVVKSGEALKIFEAAMRPYERLGIKIKITNG